jgi:xanthine dehydrogenase accessory factor
MNIEMQPGSRPVSLLAQESVLPVMWRWRCEGVRAALVTLVGIDGSAPRPLGAQMVVAEDGRYFGYASGGCLERSIAIEALDVIRGGQNRLVRYGRGSKYIDVRLPCDSGLNFQFDCTMSSELLGASVLHIAARRRFALDTDLASGVSNITILNDEERAESVRCGNRFRRVYFPHPRLLLLGSGSAVPGLAALARATGLDTEVWTPDESTRDQVRDVGLNVISESELPDSVVDRLDSASAVVLAFHEHDVEPELLRRLLKRDCFYIGALGSRGAHRARLRALMDLGVKEGDTVRIRAPVGTIRNAKSKATLAVGILAELMAAAKEHHLIC